MQVQILVHIRPGDTAGTKCYELIDCNTETRIEAIKHTIAGLGATSGRYNLPADEQVQMCSNSHTPPADTCCIGHLQSSASAGASLHGRALQQ